MLFVSSQISVDKNTAIYWMNLGLMLQLLGKSKIQFQLLVSQAFAYSR